MVHPSLLKISVSKLNHMRLVLHNRSAKENQKLVTAGRQSGGIEVEDRRWRFSQPLDDDVKL